MEDIIYFNLHTHSDQFNAFINTPKSLNYKCEVITWNNQRWAKFTLK